MIKTRKYFFAPVNTGFTSGGLPDDRFLKFYAERSGNGLYCTIVGNVVLPSGYGTNDKTPAISDSPEWASVVKAVRTAGAIPGIQLATTWPDYIGNRKFVGLDDESQALLYRSICESYSSTKLSELALDLFEGSKLAINAGFQHIQLHAAHGYLFSLLIDQQFNVRSDEVLKMLGNWLAFLRHNNVESSIRLSMRTGIEHCDYTNLRNQTIGNVVNLVPDFVDLSSGFYNIDKKLIYPSIDSIIDQRFEQSIEIAASYPKANFIVSGGLGKMEVSHLPTNVHIGLCRDLIANPEFLQTQQNGCENMMKCHYYSRGESHLTCGQWDQP